MSAPAREPIKVDEREVIDGVLYKGTACRGCGTVYLVYEQATYDLPGARFFCAECFPAAHEGLPS